MFSTIQPDRFFMMFESFGDKALMLLYFGPIFLVGVVGNLWVIITVVLIFQRSWGPINSVFKRMSIYIICLSCADLCVLSMIPLLVSYFLTGNWAFGHMCCKLFFAVENVNKLLSVGILAVMSFERFLAVSRPFHLFCCQIRRKRLSNALAVVITLLVAIILLCFPMIYYSEAVEFFDDVSGQTNTLCGSTLPDTVMTLFISYMLLLGFVAPIVFIAACYYFLIRHLRKKNGSFVTSYTHRVVISVLRVVIFHFLCWGPFWIFVLLPLLDYFQLVHFEFLQSQSSQTIRMISSFLPYLNSAGNWIFYAAMNKDIRETVIGRRSWLKTQSKRWTTRRKSCSMPSIYKRNLSNSKLKVTITGNQQSRHGSYSVGSGNY